tara:strand:- start:197 stop:1060 length:864 start_codon:yes stop_codon:yes gene_type:complete
MIMANNLDEMISRSGMTKKAVAEEKGVTPETVSRHIHSKISMTLQDVDDYARILNCLPHEIAYQSAPLPIIGAWKNCTVTGNVKCASRFSVYPEYFKKGVCVHGNYSDTYAAVIFDLKTTYRGNWFHLNKSVDLVDIEAVQNGEIDNRAIMNLSYAMTKNGVLVCGILWPQPHNDKYTMTNLVGVEDPSKRTLLDMDLTWASPVVEKRFHSKVSGFANIVDFESPIMKKHHAKIIRPQTAARKKEYGNIYDIVPEANVGEDHQAHTAEGCATCNDTNIVSMPNDAKK